MRSSKGAAFLLVVLGGLLTVLATGRTWLDVQPVRGGALTTAVEVTGREASPEAVALGLVALAGAVALVTAGPVARRVVAGLLVLCGVGLAGTVLLFARDPGTVAADAVARATGATLGSGEGIAASSTVWVGVCVAAGLLVAAGGTVAVLRGGRWAGPSRRYEVSAPVAGAGSERDRAFDAWDALSAGADPTDDRPRP